ncbi:hypothetical protein [uncultured Thiocystis sp.]|uniref:hypothetical protein n=1 Tax=uncultured Thiocystis sp. TaxID=1202134 RepID=UPI0025D46C02|nr:hypothetical protein [uncultured Thiocystis sp.]
MLDLPNLSGQEELQWMYSEASASWILWNPQTPGFIYQDLTNMIYQYNPQTLRFDRRPELDFSVFTPATEPAL